MLLADAITLFLGEYKPSTRASYSYELRRMADHIGPKRDITELSPALLTEYHQRLRSAGYSVGTVCKHVKTMKSFFNWAVRLELIERSPARTLHQPKPARYVERDKAMTDEELEAILDYTRYKYRDHALILFLADTGCRVGGAAGLRLQDLYLDTLSAQVTEKGDKTRFVVYGPACARALRVWLLKRKGQRGEYVFSRDGHRMTTYNLSQAIRRACKAVGIRVLSAHSLRHRKGHQLADAHVAPSIAATALGHSDPVITLHHYYPADWESAERELRKLVAEEIAPQKIIRLPRPG